MISIKRAYDYFFYKLYKFFEAAPSRWWSDWKASFSMLVLEIWVLVSLIVYYAAFTKKDLLPDKVLDIVAIIFVLLLTIVKYFSFEYQDRWKFVIKTFDELPKHKNKIGTYVVWGIVLLILVNLIFSFYLLSKNV